MSASVDDDDVGIVAVRRVPHVAPAVLTTPKSHHQNSSAMASAIASPSTSRTTSVRTPSSAQSVARSTSSLTSSTSTNLQRLSDGWMHMSGVKVKCGFAASSALAAAAAAVTSSTVGVAVTTTSASHATILSTSDNAIMMKTKEMHAGELHAGQRVWINTTTMEEDPILANLSHNATSSSSSCSICIGRVWPCELTSLGTRLLLTNFASLPSHLNATNVTINLRAMRETIHRAHHVVLTPSHSSSTAFSLDGALDERLERVIERILTARMQHRHLFTGAHVCVPLFDEEYEFRVMSIEGMGEEAQQYQSQVDEAESLDRIDEGIKRMKLQASTPIEAEPCETVPRLYLITSETRIQLRGADSAANSSSASGLLEPIDSSLIGGLDVEIASLRELLTGPLLEPHLFTAFGLRPPKGVLLHGPPGTGKTLLARSVAASMDTGDRAGARFYVVNGPEIIGGAVGESEQTLTALFMTARLNAPAVIFIDEIDSLCPKRTESDEMQKRIVATLLTLMDGLSTSSQHSSVNGSSIGDRVLVIGATNRPDALDTALRRAGRFDREIEVGIPNELRRRDILAKMVKKMPCTCSEKEMLYIASVTHGFVGADLKALCRESALVALERWQREQSDWMMHLNSTPEQATKKLQLTYSDFMSALPNVKPSALRSVVVDVPKVLWSDVGGQELVKQKLKEAVEWPLQHPEAFLRLGIQPPKGILLYGPPGCSKTLLAKALATESSRNFLAVRGPELFSKYVGESERSVKEIFRKARNAAPSIIFFDEIDSIGGKRSEGSGGGEGGDRVAQRVLSQLLSELDGIEPLRQVTIIAATNRPDLLDPALLRPGRIDRILYVAPPDESSCAAILRIEFRKIGAAAENVPVEEVAKLCHGMSGAEISALCREAALVAMEETIDAKVLTYAHFERARQRTTLRITEGMIKFYADYAATRAANAV